MGVQPVHTPPLRQFCAAGQAVHADPPAPHIALTLPVSHLVPVQHPFGHETPLQTHAPATHTCPAAHMGPDPQVQTPAEQPLASAPHAMHAPASAPHAIADGISHTLPWQHPAGQEAEVQVHVPATHA